MQKQMIGLLICFLLLQPAGSIAQELHALTLSEAKKLAVENYPLSRQRGVILQSSDYTLSNISKGYLPQLSLNGQASYQSDVTSVPVRLPGINIPEPEKDQYRIYAELNQSLYNGNNLKLQRGAQQKQQALESQRLEVDLYKLYERVIQVYFGILMADEQLRQVDLMMQDIRLGMDKTSAAIANGTAIKSSLDQLKAELLKADQRKIEVSTLRIAYIEMLSQLINAPVAPDANLSLPEGVNLNDSIVRPELSLFDLQQETISQQEKLLDARNLPRLNLFFQSGYGRPGLNMLSNEFETWYIGGIRLNWALSGFYTSRKEKSILALSRQTTLLQKETFLYNTRYALRMQDAEISKLAQLTESDEEIVTIRSRIKSTAATQLENGMITSSDYLREVHAEDQARLNKALHELQLLLVQYNHLYTTGN